MRALRTWLRDQWQGVRLDEPVPSFHGHLLQGVVFAYVAWRLASRDYTVYGLLPPSWFDYPRQILLELWPRPLLHYTTFQFIYDWIPRPGVDGLMLLQTTALVAALAGLAGIAPRIAAVLTFALWGHLTGFVQASNAEIEGAELAMMALLILALAPRQALYSMPLRPKLPLSPLYGGPLFLFRLCVGMYYSMSGLNKIIDVGPHWPVALHLERLSQSLATGAVFLESRLVYPAVAALLNNELLSIASGIITLVAETGFILVLFMPRLRWFFVFSMIAMHSLVYSLEGINFTGNSVMLLLCLNWNQWVPTGGSQSAIARGVAPTAKPSLATSTTQSP